MSVISQFSRRRSDAGRVVVISYAGRDYSINMEGKVESRFGALVSTGRDYGRFRGAAAGRFRFTFFAVSENDVDGKLAKRYSAAYGSAFTA